MCEIHSSHEIKHRCIFVPNYRNVAVKKKMEVCFPLRYLHISHLKHSFRSSGCLQPTTLPPFNTHTHTTTHTHTQYISFGHGTGWCTVYNRNRPCNPITYNKNSTKAPHRSCSLTEGTAKATVGDPRPRRTPSAHDYNQIHPTFKKICALKTFIVMLFHLYTDPVRKGHGWILKGKPFFFFPHSVWLLWSEINALTSN